MIGEKLTCDEEYEMALINKKQLRNELLEVKMQIALNSLNSHELAFLKEKEKILISKKQQLTKLICEFEIEKEGINYDKYKRK